MSGNRPASAPAIIAAIAELTLRRLWRGRALWVSVVIALLPLAFSGFMKSQGNSTDVRGLPTDLFVFEGLLLAVLPSMFVASSIGEEIEDRTTTYLWSRALPRWTIVVGKLVALVPIIFALVLGNWFLAMQVAGASPGPMSYVSLAFTSFAIACLSAALATLVPKHGMALSVCYILFFDLPVGGLPASLKELSITHHMRSLAELSWAPDDPHWLTMFAVALLCTFFLGIALWRIRRIES